MWSDPDRYGPHLTLCLSDPELKVTQDLGTAGRSRAMTEGIIDAMKALEIAVVVNNTSIEGEVKADVLGKERDTLAAKMTKLEEGFATSKTVVEGKDCCIILLEKQVADAQSALEQVVKAQNKLYGEKKALEEALRKATLLGVDELEVPPVKIVLVWLTKLESLITFYERRYAWL